MTDSPYPDPAVTASPRWLPSLVWIVPLVAALIGLSLVVQAVRQKGPTIFVSFATAEGIEPGKTKVKFRNVDIGAVTALRLSEDRKGVIAEIDLDKQAEAFASADSRFWVVRPRLAGSGISGLGTLLSGAYIGVDGGQSEESRDAFTGLEEPPVVSPDAPGRRFVLRAKDIGSLDVGSPVFFRRIQVGHVESFKLEMDGQQIALGVFVKSPYDDFVTPDTRFWHASGLDLRLDSSGIKLQTQSVASILMGGVAFETPSGATEIAAEGTTFGLSGDRDDALKAPDGDPITIVVRFSGSVRGLAVGAAVDFRGVRIGYVQSIRIAYDTKTDTYNAPVVMVVYPDRLHGMAPLVGDPRHRAADLVRRGLRAQLRTGSLLTGQVYVALDFFADAPPARLRAAEGDLPELPAMPGEMEEIQQQVRAIVKKVNAIPFDAIGTEVQTALVRVNATLKHLDSLSTTAQKDILPEMREALKTITQTLAGDAPMQQDTRAALRALTDAARALTSLADGLDQRPESLLRGKKETSP
ncbi:MAG: MCE family protein [Rhodospirillaceae bacterium]|nr:MCE family protein [Rhodospirillaceae bacterium]